MEDIYDNLENYDDLNKIEELKVENKELKCKIEEYTTAIGKLQENILQDFDKLAAEHKKLELNYSSLLRTAKAEIERKTQMIKDLNIEKDKLVINARLNQGQNALNKFRRSQRFKSKNEKVSDISVPDQSVGLHSKNQEVQNECKNDNDLTSLDTISSSSTNGKVNHEVEKYLENKSNNHDTRNLISKENNMQMLNKPQSRQIETKLRRISNRRKSMPALSSHDIKFNSDEECENIVMTKENKNYHQKNEDVVRRFGEKNYSNNNKISETLSVENSHSHYHDSLINNHSKNKTNRYYKNENNRNRESSQRQRWQSSPERLHHRSVKDYTADNYQRYENYRRACESPPRDKYYRNRSRDRKANYERGRGGFLHGNDDGRYGEKHKYQDDLDEPSYKRQKIAHLHHKHSENDNISQNIDDNMDSNRWQNVDDSRWKNVDDSRWQNQDNDRWQNVNDNRLQNLDSNRWPNVGNNRWQNIDSKRWQNVDENRWKNGDDDRRENEMEVSKKLISMAKELSEHVSCQSPDYVHTEYHTDTIREIMNTAVMHLEDPRLTSRKYRVINDNNKEFISTIIGKNVDITPVNKNLWGFEPVPVPKPLLEPPSRYTTEELVKNIYVDIDNPTSNLSLESGEISDADDYIISSSNTFEHEQLEKHATDPKVFVDNNEKISNIEKNNDNNYNNTANKSLVNKCKTLQLQNVSETQAKSEAVVSDINSEHTAGNNSTTHQTMENDTENNKRVEVKSMPQLNISSKSTIDIKNICNISKEKNEGSSDFKFVTKCYNELPVSARIVENDLVLSDDTSDIIEPKKKVTKKHSKSKNKKDKIDNYTEKQKSEEEIKKCRNVPKVLTETDNAAKNKENSLKVSNKNLETFTEHGKRHRSDTSKSQGNKGSDVDTPKSKSEKDIQDRTPKIQEIRTKFTDLFGDSSSLITPDDLGIVSTENEHKEKYVTMFEDTQDAMDLNIKEIEKVKGSISKDVDSEDNGKGECEKIQTRSSKPKLICASVNQCNSKEGETQKTNKQSVKKTEEKSSTIKESSDIVNIYEKVNAETPNVVKTVIISTGIQPAALCDNSNIFTQPQNVNFLENAAKPMINSAPKALATSTPAKVAQQEQTLTDSTKIRLPPDSSSAYSDDSRIVESSQTVNDSSDVNIDRQKDVDTPDVRIFVKRRRKVKKMTP